jgi:hypothetical protein
MKQSLRCMCVLFMSSVMASSLIAGVVGVGIPTSLCRRANIYNFWWTLSDWENCVYQYTYLIACGCVPPDPELGAVDCQTFHGVYFGEMNSGTKDADGDCVWGDPVPCPFVGDWAGACMLG